jgi:hypothetical protein
MQIKSEFTVDETTFQFENTASGQEIISTDGEVCSAKRSLFGGKHVFEHKGHQYSVKVKPGLGSVAFKVQKNGRKVNSVLSENVERIPLKIHVVCGCPLIMAVPAAMIGGGLGAGAAGGLGGLAYGMSMGVYKTSLKKSSKVLLILSIGVLGCVLQFFLLQYLLSQGASFPPHLSR